MSLKITNFLALTVVFLASTSALAQTADTPAMQPKKVGLVLEGGGALGLAHIGVLQWLEEHRIPVSYIAGTSMGGLVGGVYATGQSPAEVRDLVKGINWDQVMSGQTPFKDLSLRRKQDAHDYPSTLEFGLRKGLQFPSGFNSGQQVSLVLDRVSLPYSGIKSFDELPIPFACVATDLVTSSEQVFREGPLNMALRSTMSLPGIFTPVQSGDHIYVDGGMLNNFPVSVVKDMGAEITLGVHLAIAPLKPDATLSSFSVMNASISAVVAANEKRAMKDVDFLVTVPLEKYTSMDFNRSDEIIKAGYAAAAANAERLSSLSVDEVTWNQYLAEREARRRKAATPEFVEVTGVAPEIAQPLADNLSGFAGKPVNSAKLEQEITELAGTGPFARLNYSITEKNAQEGLQIHAEEKPYAPPTVRPLILIDGSDYNDVLFSIGARITFFDFGGYRRELRNDVLLGSRYGISSEYYRPFDPTSNWFVAPRAGFNSYQYLLYHKNHPIAQYRNRLALGGLDVGYALGSTGEVRLGYEGGYQRLSPQIGFNAELPTVSGTTGNFSLQYVLNTLDQPVVPREGTGVKFYAKYFHQNPGAPHGFPLSELQIGNFFRLSDPSSVFINACGGTSYGYKTGIPAFQLGGATRFVAYGTNELLTNQYVLGQLGYIRKLKNLPPLLGSTIDFLGMFEVGQTYQIPNGPRPPHLPGDLVGALVVNTLFGPVEVGAALGNYGHTKFFFQIGRVF